MMIQFWRRTCMAALLLVVMLPPAAGAAPGYFSTYPASGKYSHAIGLNDAGRYAVNSTGWENPYEGASINSQFAGESVGSLGGYITRIRSLNNAGEAVGVSTTAQSQYHGYHAFLYSGGHLEDLTVRHGLHEPSDINNRGQIAAQTRDSRAALLSGGAVDVFGPENSSPGDMNNRGELLVGYFANGTEYRIAVYSDGTLTDLPRAGGRLVFGYAINDAGWVTGYFTSAQGRNHAFLWDGQTFTNLTPWAANSFGYDINNLGQVVGIADDRAFLYADGELIDLNTRIDRDADLLLKYAYEINERSQIMTHSCDRTGVFCYGATLLTPVPGVPEPSAIAMLLAGLALAGAHPLRRLTRRSGAHA